MKSQSVNKSRKVVPELRVKKELLASEIRYRRLFESAKDGIVILDAESGKIVDVNPFLISLLGFSKEKFIEKEIWELGLFKDITANKDKFLELQQQEYVRYENLPLETADGRKINVEFVSNVYLVDKKKVIQCNIRDITERKKIENDLIDSENLRRTLIQTIPDLIWSKDKNGKYLSCNTMFERFFGAGEDEIIGKTDYDFIDRDSADFFSENDRKTMSAGKPTINEEWITFPDDGRRVYLETIKAPMYNSQNELIGILGIGRDITIRKEAEDALLESEVKYRTIVETTAEGIWVVDKEWRTSYVNPAMTAMMGYSSKELLGHSPVEFVIPVEVQKASEQMKRREKGITEKTEVRMVRKDGTIIWTYGTSVSLLDDKGEFAGGLSMVSDITDSKLDEKEIAMLSHSLKSVKECVSITDLDDNILFVNESFLETYGYDISEVIGEKINIVRSQNNDQRQINNILSVTISGEWQGELLNKRKDGSEFPVYLSTSVIKDKENNILGLIGVATDISDRKLAEKELIKAKENAEESDRLKTAFLANMSHEIRTPMNGILGFTQLLKEPMLTGEEQQEYLNIIEKSGTRMLNIINDLVSISKIESGQMDILISETNVNEQIEYIFNFFKPEAENKKLHLSYKKTLPEKEALINTDKEKVTAILSNLVNNAIKFTSAGTIEFGYEKKGDWLEFFVKDTGIGVPGAQKELIFERFRQGSELLTRNYEGAGLGLSISRAYVEMIGGKIWVENDHDYPISAGISGKKGSSFYFTIPYYPMMTANIPHVDDSNVNGKENPINNLKILIVEDDRISELLLSITINKMSQNVLKVSTGLEAVNTCRNNPDIDLVLMDIKMPVMDGYEATRQIRKFNKDVIIIAQTAYGLSGDREAAIEAGCNDYISKPLDPILLKKVIENHFNK